jgi:signal peptidase I
MTRTRLIAPVLTATLAVVVAVGFVFVAPVQLGGRTAYVITSGSSMEPTFHGGDLVLTRQNDSYDVGDIVLYRSAELGRDVLHRIVGRDGDRLVLKGDNNGYKDPEHPHIDQVRGEAWLLVPGGGRPLGWLRQPLVLAALAFLAVFGLLAGGREVSRRRGHRMAHEPLRVEQPLPAESLVVPHAVLTGAAAAAVLFAVLAVVAFARPATRAVEIADAWRHTGTFSYEASVTRSAVYPDGTVASGETVFTNLVRRLRVAFAYGFEASEVSDVRGGVGLEAVVADGQGWSRSLPIRAEQPFSAGSARVEGVLDLRAVRAVVDRMKELSGSTATLFTVAVTPTVQVAGYAGAAVIDETYRPTLVLQLDDVSLRPVQGADDAPPAFDVEEAGTATMRAPREIALGVTTLSVESARTLAALGLVVSLLAVGGAGALVVRRAGTDEAGRIQARYGSRIVTARVEIPDGRWLTDVRSIDELARIAEHYDRVILRHVEAGGDAYLVDDGVAVYRYVPAQTSPVSRSALPVPGA